MPHIIFECSEELLSARSAKEVIQSVHKTVFASNLFNEGDIKIRVQRYRDYSVGGQREAFIHLSATIMPGRTIEQRAQLSRSVVENLTKIFIDVKHITMSINEFDKSVFFNAKML